MKRLLLLLIFASGFTVVKAQRVAFSYDQNGNRVSREIKLPGQRLDNSIIDTAAISELLGSTELLIYPNPVLTEITIKINSPDVLEFNDAQINVLNVSGVHVGSAFFNQNQSKFNFSNLPTGVYLVIVTGNGFKKEIKIIKE